MDNIQKSAAITVLVIFIVPLFFLYNKKTFPQDDIKANDAMKEIKKRDDYKPIKYMTIGLLSFFILVMAIFVLFFPQQIIWGIFIGTTPIIIYTPIKQNYLTKHSKNLEKSYENMEKVKQDALQKANSPKIWILISGILIISLIVVFLLSINNKLGFR